MHAAERRRILELLEAGRISAKQAAELLEALGSYAGAAAPPPPPEPPDPRGGVRAGQGRPRPRPPARVVRIKIDAQEPGKEPIAVNVAVPLALTRFASRFLPSDARRELEHQGIDLQELLDGLQDVDTDGPLLEIDADDDGDGRQVHVRIDVA